jgi:hypothetical protein
MLRNQRKRSLVVKGTRYPFLEEGFCVNRAETRLLTQCEMISQPKVLTVC